MTSTWRPHPTHTFSRGEWRLHSEEGALLSELHVWEPLIEASLESVLN